MQTRTAVQAPPTPSGFIQNEQGALIAVYQPETLNHYMGSGNDQNMVDYQAPTCPGQPSVAGFAGGAPHRISDLRHSPMPFRGGALNANPPLNPMFRRSQSHHSATARNQSTSFPRMFPAKPGSAYLHNTGSDHGRRGGQLGRPFGDWNR